MNNETTFYPERLTYRGNGIWLYQEPRSTVPHTRRLMAIRATVRVEEPLTLLYRNTPDMEVRNYVLQLTELYDKAQAKRSKSINI